MMLCRKSRCTTVLLVFLASAPIFAQNFTRSTTQTDQPSVSSDKGAPANLKIGPGDLLEIKVYDAPELSDTLRVSNDGEITVPLAGAMKVAGESIEEAQKQVEQRLLSGGYLRDPHVNILVKEFASQGISVLGEVTRPGI